jgi:type IV pilus assembly protein PilY1
MKNLRQAVMEKHICKFSLAAILFFAGCASVSAQGLTSLNISQDPLFLVGPPVPPRAILNISNDNQLFFNAYPEYADLDGDGSPDLGYNNDFDYFGYFDVAKCYTFNDTTKRFVPASITTDHKCTGLAGDWSGNFLNWLTMARIDTVRKILYGGKRVEDTTALTVLERTYLPNDAHSWVRYYDGDDIAAFTPLKPNTSSSVTSPSEVSIAAPPSGERNDDDYRRTFAVTGWDSSDVQLGDQVEIVLSTDDDTWMRGVVRSRNLKDSPPTVQVQVTSSNNPSSLEGARGGWTITNRTRRGYSFCNTTVSTADSQDVTDPPLLRVASGNYSLWTANERWQCRWEEEKSRTGHSNMQVGGLDFSNGNDVTASNLWANSENPIKAEVGASTSDYEVRVEVCVAGLVGSEDCQEYGTDILKPVGLLQEFGGTGSAGLRFGLLSGTYSKNLSGGVLRKNIGSFSDEINAETGQFITPTSGESIVKTLDSFRLIGYNHGTGVYSGAGDACGTGVQKSQMQDGKCMNWGNPQAEIFAESLRYFAGLPANSAFSFSGTDDQLPGLIEATWVDPVDPVEWCSPLTVLQFNSSVTSFDDNAVTTGLPDLTSLDTFTNKVGTGENLNGASVFVGNDNRLCTAETLSGLSAFTGICPEAPNQDGTYDIAGLAHYAWTNDLRTDVQGTQNVKTFGVSLAPAVPRIEVPDPNGSGVPVAVLLPACENKGDGGLRCALADFKIIDQDTESGTGSFFIQWDVHEWGSDFDMDINGTLSYKLSGNQLTVTTETWSVSSSRATGFGFIISGTTQDGFHAYSGINNYSMSTSIAGVPACNDCEVTDPPVSHSFTIGEATAELLREPLFYASKWGGYDQAKNFPTDPLSWDADEDGLPDNYVLAADPAALKSALVKTFQQILALSDRTSISTESSRVREGSLLYRAEFSSEDWSGDVKAINPFSQIVQWSAGTEMPTERNLIASSTSGGESFNALSSTSDVRTKILGSVAEDAFGADFDPSNNDGDASALLAYIAGDDALEGTRFRERETVIGDIINAELKYSGPTNEGWIRLPEDEGGGVDGYGQYVDCLKQDEDDFDPENAPEGCTAGRNNAVFVGSNAGMLHAFDADTGEELFGFIPRAVQSELWRLALPSYTDSGQKRAFVDGQVVVADAFDGTDWATILVGGLGAGGRSVYALDVSDPQNFDEDDVLWELTAEEDSRLGHVFDRPRIVRLENASGTGTWAAVFGNGYGSADGQGYLFAVDLFTGSTLDVVSVPATTIEIGKGNEKETVALQSGLSAPAVLSKLGGLSAEAIYAGDLAGNLWRFDVEDGKLLSPVKVFEDELRRPITAPPTVARGSRGEINVFFGTGKLFEVGDSVVAAENEPIQALFRVVDSGTLLTTADLGSNSIISKEGGGRTITISDSSANGWYVPLSVDSAATGERILRQMPISAGRLIVRSYEPNDDACVAGGIVRSYPLDAISGALASGQDGELEVLEREGAPSGGSGVVILEDPISGTEPTEPPDPPDLESGDTPTDLTGILESRDAWCPDFGFYDLDGNFISLGTICDGRQAWRQIQ